MTRLPAPAQYLLRVDDLCPTMHAERWRRLCELMDEFAPRPILAVVPDNRDPELAVSAPDPGFWQQMRERQAGGATVALHGYRHACKQKGRSLVPMHRISEFAGVSLEKQHRWIDSGLAILRNQGLEPRLWAAPRHGFDRNTLRALRGAGIEYLSDGLGRLPVRRDGVVWIPQQLWRPAEKASGVWTICIHPNTMTESDALALRSFLNAHAEQFTSFQRVIEEWADCRPPLRERGWEAFQIARIILRRTYSSR
jgi:predicted deacetylase